MPPNGVALAVYNRYYLRNLSGSLTIPVHIYTDWAKIGGV